MTQSSSAGRARTRLAHRAAGVFAMSLIALFQITTIAAELRGGAGLIITVKSAILALIPFLIGSMIVLAGSGRALGRGWRDPRVARKAKRMTLVVFNGVFILVPAAAALFFLARAGDFGPAFFAIQALELAAGLFNLVLLALNARDGFALARRD